jgi:hypothetical protein
MYASPAPVYYAPQPDDPNHYYPAAANYDPNQTATPYVDYNAATKANEPLLTQPTYVNTTTTTLVVGTNYEDKSQYDTAVLLLIIGFFFPIMWIVAFAITRKQGQKAKTVGNISCILMSVSFICYIIIIVVSVSVRFAVIAAYASTT